MVCVYMCACVCGNASTYGPHVRVGTFTRHTHEGYGIPDRSEVDTDVLDIQEMVANNLGRFF